MKARYKLNLIVGGAALGTAPFVEGWWRVAVSIFAGVVNVLWGWYGDRAEQRKASA